MGDNFPNDQSDTNRIPDLEDMLAMQRELQKEYTGQDPVTLSPEGKMEYIRSQSLALTDEIHEVLAETGWKPWASSNHINLEAYKGEIVDGFHFFMNLMLVVGMTADELATGYDEKQKLNWKRIREGYTGLKKCPTCKRAYDDPATKCTEPEGPGMNPRCQDISDPVPYVNDNRNHYVSDLNGYETS